MSGHVRPIVEVAGIRIIENKVVNGCVTRGNLLNSSGQILKKAQKHCLMSLSSIR
jgi:hypothetical protein